MTAPPPPPPADGGGTSPAVIRRSILYVIGSAGTFALAAAGAKALGPELPLMQMVFCRNLFALPVLLVLLARAGGLPALRTRHFGTHCLRTSFGMMGMVGSFYGWTHLPLATVTALGFTMPLFLTALSVPLLKQKVGWRRTSAVVVGFLGVLLMVRPGLGEEALDLFAAGLVLLGAVGWALAMMTIRNLGERGEPGVVIVLWFALISTTVAGLVAAPTWVWPNATQWLLLASIGFVSAAAQLLMTEGYRRADTTLLAPFEYSAILWTTALGALVWGEWPDVWDIAGIAVLVGAGLYIWRREARLGVRR